jgi:SAM-dependent methyltransferase
MSFIEKYVKQCRKPEGKLGRFVGRTMNYGHGSIRKWGLKHIRDKNYSCILDIGCGGGMAIKELSSIYPDSKVYGIDYSEDMVELSKKYNKKNIRKGLVEIQKGNVSSLPFCDDFFDLITAFETYYFWPDLKNDLTEIKRVLKSEGRLLMVNEAYEDINFKKRNEKWCSLLDMKLHNPEEYRIFLEDAGYENIDIDIIPTKNWICAVAGY